MLQNYQSILVPVDGSFEAEMAFNKAVEVAKRNHAALTILHVVDTRAFQDVSSFDSSMVEQVSQTAQQTINEYEQLALQKGVTSVKTSIQYGAPKTKIARTIPKDLNIDLIVIGATGLNAVERLLIGSVTEFVTRNAPCDVMVVRTDLQNQTIKDQPRTETK